MIELNPTDPAEPQLWDVLARVIDPGEAMPPDVWAEKHITLSPRETRFSGPLRLDRTPYMRGPLRALVHPKYRRILLAWGGQLGKTTAMQLAFAYVVDQDPGPAMMAFPNRNFAKRRSRTHIQPMITSNPSLARRVSARSDALQNFQFTFDRMSVNLAWAGSSAVLASEPIRWLFRDEIDKWKHVDRDEGHPVDLSEVRTTSYAELARIIDGSTPGLKTGKVCEALDAGTHHQLFVPCQHCGKPEQLADIDIIEHQRTQDELAERLKAAGYQVLKHSQFTGFEDLTDPDEIRKRTVYQCEHCQKTFDFSAIRTIVPKGKWIPKRANTSLCSMQLPRWYRDLDSCSFGECQAAFIASKSDPIKLQNWINSYAAEGWEEMGAERSQDEIREHCRAYAWQTCPFVPLFIIATVDLRASEIHVIVRAWTYHETSALLGHYLLPRLSKYDPTQPPTGASLANLDAILEKTFTGPHGEQYGVTLTAIDSGYDTDEVYEYCRTRANCVAMKGDEKLSLTLGVSKPMKTPGTNEPAPDSPFLITFQSNYFSDVLHYRLNVSPGAPGDWQLPTEVSDDYVKHMISERKILVVKKFGRPELRWKMFGRANHWRDCEKMQMAIARYLDIRSMVPKTETTADAAAPASFINRDTSDFVKRFQR